MNVSPLLRVEEADFDAARLRQLAETCRRLATNMYDESTVAVLRRMAREYENLAQEQDSGVSDGSATIRTLDT